MAKVIAYVVSGSGGSPTVVTPVNVRTRVAGPPITFATGGQSIAVTPNGKTVYVPTADAVIPIDTVTNTALPAIAVGSEPFSILVTPSYTSDGVAL
jgi:YVTN family beta-propeller protein